MYKNSYKGFKKKNKYKRYKSNYGAIGRKTKVKKQRGTAHLQVIRVVVVVLAVAVIVSAVTAGFVIYGNNNSENLTGSKTVATDNSEELLRVVNRTNSLDSDYVPDLKECDGYSVNTLASSSLKKLLEDASESEIDLEVNYAYVSYEEQAKRYKKAYKKLKNSSNLSQVKAQAQTELTTPKAGNSEYQTGLLVNFSTSEKCDSFKDSKAYRFLVSKGVNYGFIIRYQDSKKSVTSMNGNAHAFRYVGEDYAKQMRALNMCLDEYSDYLNSR